jgi:hypothetical protein
MMAPLASTAMNVIILVNFTQIHPTHRQIRPALEEDVSMRNVFKGSLAHRRTPPAALLAFVLPNHIKMY